MLSATFNESEAATFLQKLTLAGIEISLNGIQEGSELRQKLALAGIKVSGSKARPDAVDMKLSVFWDL